MGKARNLSVLLAADGQVEDAKIDGLTSSKLTGDLPALSAANLTSIPAGNLTGSIASARLPAANQTAKLALSGGALTGAVTTNSTFDGRDVSVDGAKLDLIEANATADQTGAQIKTAYEAESDTNALTDTLKTKLDGIETGATADQTNEEIQDVVGGMVTGNTESGITVTYEDSDGTLDLP